MAGQPPPRESMSVLLAPLHRQTKTHYSLLTRHTYGVTLLVWQRFVTAAVLYVPSARGKHRLARPWRVFH